MGPPSILGIGQPVMNTASGHSQPWLDPAPRDRVSVITRGWAVATAVVTYITVLHTIYQYSIAPVFSYLQYTYRDPDPVRYSIAIVMVVALALILPRRIVQPSQFVGWILFIVAVAPSILVPQFTDVLSTDAAFEVAIWVFVSFLPVATIGTRRAVRDMLPTFTISASTFWTGLVVVSIVLYAYVIVAVGVHWELPSIDDVYGVRGEFKMVESSSSFLLRYAVPLLGNVLTPLIIARGMLERRWTWLVVGVLGEVFIYSFTGYRSAVLSPLVLLGAYLLFRRNSRPASVVVLVSVMVLTLLSWAMDWLTSSNDYTSLFVRRFLITPGLLTAGYVWVFADTDKAHFAYSFLGFFFTYPYSKEPPDLVGELFFGHVTTHANANLLADGYANFGFPGMVLECLVLTVLLWVIDDACRGLSIRVAVLVLAMPTFALADTGLFTTLLTEGLLAATVACMLMPRSGWGRPPPGRNRPRRRRGGYAGRRIRPSGRHRQQRGFRGLVSTTPNGS